ncbi:MAG: hypothetical protein AMS20_04140 [Gemmatimonas sp. SG8_28]|nr:MAG: hypothetical protein AMS20_04140 [Gemmatimonas sp. SG8_28]
MRQDPAHLGAVDEHVVDPPNACTAREPGNPIDRLHHGHGRQGDERSRRPREARRGAQAYREMDVAGQCGPVAAAHPVQPAAASSDAQCAVGQRGTLPTEFDEEVEVRAARGLADEEVRPRPGTTLLAPEGGALTEHLLRKRRECPGRVTHVRAPARDGGEQPSGVVGTVSDDEHQLPSAVRRSMGLTRQSVPQLRLRHRIHRTPMVPLDPDRFDTSRHCAG